MIPHARELVNGNKAVTPDTVTQLYGTRNKLWSATSMDQLTDSARALSIDLDGLDWSGDLTRVRKRMFHRFFAENYPHSMHIEGHGERLGQITGETASYLRSVDAHMAVGVFGSWANGRINDIHSDLDFMVFVDGGRSPAEVQRELEKLRGLKDLGFVFSEQLGPFDDLCPILGNNTGLGRLYGMTTDGVETEFHVIGGDDAIRMHSMQPGLIRRVRSVSPKTELRTSFDGRREWLPKPPDHVPNFIRHDGSMFIGFFPLHASICEWIYDFDGIGARVQQNIWDAMVKGFAYYNGAIEKVSGGYGIRLDRIPFENYMQIMYYNDPNRYSPQKLDLIKQQYHHALQRVIERYRMTLLD